VEENKAVLKLKFSDPTRTSSRPITSVAFSPRYKELVLVSYAALEDNLTMEPDGLVLVWSMHTPQRPEYSFHCQSAVLSAQFHPTNPRLIIGATYSGQVPPHLRSCPLLSQTPQPTDCCYAVCRL
jgi:dynein intermediate chain, cytosolic